MTMGRRDPRRPDSHVRAGPWMVFGPPAAALLLLLALELLRLDQPLFFRLNSLSSYTGPGFWAHATILGDGLVCAVLLLPWIRRHPERIWGGLMGAVFMVLVLHTFKGVLTLPRPLGVLPEDLVTVIGPRLRRGSFPSGHTSTMTLLAGVWALTTLRRFVPPLALTLALTVGVSRIAVGVHWPVDVLAGFSLGWVSAWVGLRVADRVPWGLAGPGEHILTGALFLSAVVLLVIDHTGYPGVLPFQRTLALSCITLGVLQLRR